MGRPAVQDLHPGAERDTRGGLPVAEPAGSRRRPGAVDQRGRRDPELAHQDPGA